MKAPTSAYMNHQDSTEIVDLSSHLFQSIAETIPNEMNIPRITKCATRSTMFPGTQCDQSMIVVKTERIVPAITTNKSDLRKVSGLGMDISLTF